MMPGMLIFVLASLAIVLPAGWVASRIFRHQWLSAALLYLCLVLLQMTLIGLFAGIIYQLTGWALLIGAIVSGTILILVSQKLSASANHEQITTSSETPSNQGTTTRGAMILGGMGAVLAIPVYPIIGDLLKQVHLVHPLSWDVVSYHLPNVMDYIQAHSLWTLQSEYNQYPGGNELLQIWSFLPLKLDSLLGFTTLILGLGILLVSTLLLKNTLAMNTPFERGVSIVILWAICLYLPPFQEILFDFGRNDIALGFWQLVALWSLQQSVKEDSRRPWWLLWAGSSLGLAMGIKPNGIFYVLCFVGLILSPIYPLNQTHDRYVTKAKLILQFLIPPVILLGGFWYIRNLLSRGFLFDRSLTEAAVELSILRSLFNPGLYQINLPLIVFAISIGITLVATIFCVKYAAQISSDFKLAVAFSWIAIVALILMPSGAGYIAGANSIFRIQIRYSIAIIPIAAILLLSMSSYGWESFKATHPAMQTRSSTWLEQVSGKAPSISSQLVLGGVTISGAILVGLQMFTYQPPQGLPGFNQILFARDVPPSQVYSWVQANVRNSTIYAIGLRPYGLYGFPFTNRVIYELSSDRWQYPAGRAKLLQFKPDYLAISRDPFTTNIPPDVAELINRPTIFKLVYQDPLAAVFQLTEYGKSLLEKS